MFYPQISHTNQQRSTTFCCGYEQIGYQRNIASDVPSGWGIGFVDQIRSLVSRGRVFRFHRDAVHDGTTTRQRVSRNKVLFSDGFLVGKDPRAKDRKMEGGKNGCEPINVLLPLGSAAATSAHLPSLRRSLPQIVETTERHSSS